MGSSGDPEQPVSIQHIEGVLVGARKGQRADIQWILKWLKPSNVWCSCSSRFRCVQQIVTFLHTFCYITQALKHFIVFLCKIVYLSFRFLYGTVFHPDIDFAKWKFERSNNGGGRIPEKYLTKSTSQKARQYLIQKFNNGQDTGQKEDPAQVAKDTQTASRMDGERMFDRTERFSKC